MIEGRLEDGEREAGGWETGEWRAQFGGWRIFGLLTMVIMSLVDFRFLVISRVCVVVVPFYAHCPIMFPLAPFPWPHSLCPFPPYPSVFDVILPLETRFGL